MSDSALIDTYWVQASWSYNLLKGTMVTQWWQLMDQPLQGLNQQHSVTSLSLYLLLMPDDSKLNLNSLWAHTVIWKCKLYYIANIQKKRTKSNRFLLNEMPQGFKLVYSGSCGAFSLLCVILFIFGFLCTHERFFFSQERVAYLPGVFNLYLLRCIMYFASCYAIDSFSFIVLAFLFI